MNKWTKPKNVFLPVRGIKAQNFLTIFLSKNLLQSLLILVESKRKPNQKFTRSYTENDKRRESSDKSLLKGPPPLNPVNSFFFPLPLPLLPSTSTGNQS